MDNLSSRGGVDVEVTRPGSDSLTFSVTGHNTESQTGAIYRAIISADGNLSANFTNNIGNTTVTANAGGISNTINAPSLNTLTPQGIGNSFSGESLAAVDNTGIRGPGGLSDIADGLVAISGLTAVCTRFRLAITVTLCHRQTLTARI
jgi:filamentous hemagglutinin